MDLKRAIALAAKYTDKEDGPEQCVRLLPGASPIVAATNGVAGVAVGCPAIAGLAEPMAVNGVGLKRMIDALGGDAKLAIGKGRKLTLTAGGSTLAIQALPEKSAPTTPDPPTTHWLELSGTAIAALASVARLVDPDIRGNPALGGVYLGAQWAAGATGAHMAVAWVPTFAAPIVVPPTLLADVEREDAALWSQDGRTCWLRQGERWQWSRLLDAQWPADAVGQVLAHARASTARVASAVSLPALAGLARQALAACESRADAFRLVIEGDVIRLVGGDNSGKYGARDFDGTIPGKANAPTKAVVLVSPYGLRALADVICDSANDGFVSVAGERDPVLLWGGDPAVETMMLPLVG